MISWIDIKYKNQYTDSANATGIRYKFYEYDNVLDATIVKEINSFITFLRKRYYFPIRLNILFCNTQGFKHHLDNHTYYGAFYSMDDEKRKIYPRISIAANVAENNSLQDIFFYIGTRNHSLLSVVFFRGKAENCSKFRNRSK